jgi:hypothetical protein
LQSSRTKLDEEPPPPLLFLELLLPLPVFTPPLELLLPPPPITQSSPVQPLLPPSEQEKINAIAATMINTIKKLAGFVSLIFIKSSFFEFVGKYTRLLPKKGEKQKH